MAGMSKLWKAIKASAGDLCCGLNNKKYRPGEAPPSTGRRQQEASIHVAVQVPALPSNICSLDTAPAGGTSMASVDATSMPQPLSRPAAQPMLPNIAPVGHKGTTSEATSCKQPALLNSNEAPETAPTANSSSVKIDNTTMTLEVALRKLGLERQEVPGDTYCLFNAVACLLGVSPEELFNIVVAYLKRLSVDEWAKLPSLKQYGPFGALAALLEDPRMSHWGCDIHLGVLATLLQRAIMVATCHNNCHKTYDITVVRPLEGLPVCEDMQQLLRRVGACLPPVLLTILGGSSKHGDHHYDTVRCCGDAGTEELHARIEVAVEGIWTATGEPGTFSSGTDKYIKVVQERDEMGQEQRVTAGIDDATFPDLGLIHQALKGKWKPGQLELAHEVVQWYRQQGNGEMPDSWAAAYQPAGGDSDLLQQAIAASLQDIGMPAESCRSSIKAAYSCVVEEADFGLQQAIAASMQDACSCVAGQADDDLQQAIAASVQDAGSCDVEEEDLDLQQAIAASLQEVKVMPYSPAAALCHDMDMGVIVQHACHSAHPPAVLSSSKAGIAQSAAQAQGCVSAAQVLAPSEHDDGLSHILAASTPEAAEQLGQQDESEAKQQGGVAGSLQEQQVIADATAANMSGACTAEHVAAVGTNRPNKTLSSTSTTKKVLRALKSVLRSTKSVLSSSRSGTSAVLTAVSVASAASADSLTVPAVATVGEHAAVGVDASSASVAQHTHSSQASAPELVEVECVQVTHAAPTAVAVVTIHTPATSTQVSEADSRAVDLVHVDQAATAVAVVTAHTLAISTRVSEAGSHEDHNDVLAAVDQQQRATKRTGKLVCTITGLKALVTRKLSRSQGGSLQDASVSAASAAGTADVPAAAATAGERATGSMHALCASRAQQIHSSHTTCPEVEQPAASTQLPEADSSEDEKDVASAVDQQQRAAKPASKLARTVTGIKALVTRKLSRSKGGNSLDGKGVSSTSSSSSRSSMQGDEHDSFTILARVYADSEVSSPTSNQAGTASGRSEHGAAQQLVLVDTASLCSSSTTSPSEGTSSAASSQASGIVPARARRAISPQRLSKALQRGLQSCSSKLSKAAQKLPALIPLGIVPFGMMPPAIMQA